MPEGRDAERNYFMTLTERIRLAKKLGYGAEHLGLLIAKYDFPFLLSDPDAKRGYEEGRAILELGEGR